MSLCTLQANAQEIARSAAKEGLTEQLRGASSQIEALSESNAGLRSTLEKLRTEVAQKEANLKEVRDLLGTLETIPEFCIGHLY